MGVLWRMIRGGRKGLHSLMRIAGRCSLDWVGTGTHLGGQSKLMSLFYLGLSYLTKSRERCSGRCPPSRTKLNVHRSQPDQVTNSKRNYHVVYRPLPSTGASLKIHQLKPPIISHKFQNHTYHTIPFLSCTFALYFVYVYWGEILPMNS